MKSAVKIFALFTSRMCFGHGMYIPETVDFIQWLPTRLGLE
jgi:hypothetical protein